MSLTTLVDQSEIDSLKAQIEKLQQELEEARTAAIEGVGIAEYDADLLRHAVESLLSDNEPSSRAMAESILRVAKTRSLADTTKMWPHETPGEAGATYHDPVPPELGTLDPRVTRILYWADQAVRMALGRAEQEPQLQKNLTEYLVLDQIRQALYETGGCGDGHSSISEAGECFERQIRERAERMASLERDLEERDRADDAFLKEAGYLSFSSLLKELDYMRKAIID